LGFRSGTFKRTTASLFYKLLGRMSSVAIPADVGDFRLIDRKVLTALRQMPAPLGEENFRNYGASSSPTIVMVDRKGIVRVYHPGAMTYPEMVAGDERICTEVMRLGRRRFFAKTGAEASYGIAFFDRGLGLALKVEDGGARAVEPAVVECLRQAGALEGAAVAALARFHRPAVRNHRNEVVGELVPVLDLAGTFRS
jgi:hypothetical protein